MKQIGKKEIEKTVKEEYREAREWCSMDHFRYYKMMLDISDGDIWADTFLNENEWKVYHSDTIIALDCTPGCIGEIVSSYVDDAIRLLKGAGWTITD